MKFLIDLRHNSLHDAEKFDFHRDDFRFRNARRIFIDFVLGICGHVKIEINNFGEILKLDNFSMVQLGRNCLYHIFD